jgi:phosphonate transport system ATP-binding protein
MAIVEVEDVGHVYPGGKRALDQVSLTIERGERVGLVGPSGAGKSTLLRSLNGLVVPTAGRVKVLDEDVRALGGPELMQLRRQIGMIFQEFALIERLTVLTNVLVGRLAYTPRFPSIFRSFPRKDVQIALEALLQVGLQGFGEREVRKLSGGQKQRVGIARALAQEAQLILGDEPTANLDVRTADETLSLLVRLAEERKTTLVLSLHDVRAARKFCTRVVALTDGSIAWDGPATEFDDHRVEEVFYSTHAAKR